MGRVLALPAAPRLGRLPRSGSLPLPHGKPLPVTATPLGSCLPVAAAGGARRAPSPSTTLGSSTQPTAAAPLQSKRLLPGDSAYCRCLAWVSSLGLARALVRCARWAAPSRRVSRCAPSLAAHALCVAQRWGSTRDTGWDPSSVSQCE